MEPVELSFAFGGISCGEDVLEDDVAFLEDLLDVFPWDHIGKPTAIWNLSCAGHGCFLQALILS